MTQTSPNFADTDSLTDTDKLARHFRDAMRSVAEVSVLDGESKQWEVRTWRQVHSRSAQIAKQLLDDASSAATGPARPGALGLIGDPTIDLIAAIQGAFLAGVAVSILPGPVRGADRDRWAETTYERFVGVGVTTVLGGGTELAQLSEIDGTLRVTDARTYGVDADAADFEPVPASPEDPAILQGTAGSTGEPKTAVISRAAALTNAVEMGERLGLSAEHDVGFSWLPLYHDMGLMFLLGSMGVGGPIFVVPNTAFAASPFSWPKWLTETRATVTGAPNFAYDLLGRYGRLLRDADLSHLRVAISGGEPIDPDAFDKFLAEAAKVGFDPAAATPAFGMAESACAVTMPSAGEGANYDDVLVTPPGGGEAIRRRYAILGEPLPGMEIRVVTADVAVQAIAGRDVGSVEIRGTSMMSGYLGQPPLRPGEWFATGDLGYLIDGRLVICGRSKEIIIVAGRNLYPVEVERAAATVKGVRSGGVVAVARAESSSRPGLVVIAEFRGRDADAARADVGTAVAAECGVLPTDVVFVDPGTLPRTTSGKLRRLEAKELLESGTWG